MAAFEKFRENWVRPALFFGNNPISFVGGALTSGSAVIMLGYWVTEMLGQVEQQSLPGHYFLPDSSLYFCYGPGNDSHWRLSALQVAPEAGNDSQGLSQGRFK